jgi:AraC-like DNA-binding protein
MPSSCVLTFTDPHPYQAAIRAAELEILPTAKGNFRAELTRIDLHRLWMQRGRESRPRVFHGAVSPDRAVIGFLAEMDQPAVRHCGMDVSPGEIIVDHWGSMHRRTEAPCHWASMSLTPGELAAASNAIAGRDLRVPSTTRAVRPAPALMARLLALHMQAGQLAKTAPDVLARPQVARALEQSLVHAMVTCLTEGTSIEMRAGGHHHAAVMAQLEELLAANHDRPLYLAEICATTGVSERTLRICCQEHLGMGPVHYLWLRRMHFARRALVLADPATATVTEIATEFGFWELGRFSVEYRALFGEPPSTSLRRPPRVPIPTFATACGTF